MNQLTLPSLPMPANWQPSETEMTIIDLDRLTRKLEQAALSTPDCDELYEINNRIARIIRKDTQC